MSLESVSGPGPVPVGARRSAPPPTEGKTAPAAGTDRGSRPAEPLPAEAARTAERERLERTIDRDRLGKAVEDANHDIETLNQRLSFRVHDGSGQLMVQVVDRDSGDVVRTNPPEEFLDLAVRLHEMVGLFLDETG